MGIVVCGLGEGRGRGDGHRHSAGVGVVRGDSKSPRRWWFWFWVAAVPLIILGAVVEPLVVEPLFFKFTPLVSTEPRLAGNIEQMTIRAGAPIPQDRIFEMNASAKLKALNAYVTGLGASKRVVVWDTTIRRMSEDEVLFVTGHEMGHYVLGHVRKGILFSAVVLLFFSTSPTVFFTGRLRAGGKRGRFAALTTLLRCRS